MTRIAVVGGGVIGLSAAVRLARAGHDVTVFEPDLYGQAASWGNAGHIATEQVTPLASPATLRSAPRRLFALGGPLDLPLSGMAAWLPFAREFAPACRAAACQRGEAALASLLGRALEDWQGLAADLGVPDLVRDDGHFVLRERAPAPNGDDGGRTGMQTGSTTFVPVSPDDAARLKALTRAPIHDAIRFSGSGQIADLDRLRTALEAGLEAAGGRIVRSAARMHVEAGRAVIDGLDSDEVLVAAGVRSGRLMQAAGHRVPIIAERGYHIRAALDPDDANRWPADLPPVVFEDRSMIVTRYDDSVQASGFVEFSTVDAPPDPRKWLRLERQVAELGLPVAGPFRRWMGARPTLPDYLPAIGRSDRAANLVYAFGHQHLGLSLAAVTAGMVEALIEGAAPVVDPSPFTLNRFDRKASP